MRHVSSASLVSVLMNKASTPMGRRLFKARLNASASTSVIAARYNAVDEILQRESPGTMMRS
jgi:DNA mismatch repair ATPase MutS